MDFGLSMYIKKLEILTLPPSNGPSKFKPWEKTFNINSWKDKTWIIMSCCSERINPTKIVMIFYVSFANKYASSKHILIVRDEIWIQDLLKLCSPGPCDLTILLSFPESLSQWIVADNAYRTNLTLNILFFLITVINYLVLANPWCLLATDFFSFLFLSISISHFISAFFTFFFIIISSSMELKELE